jgi:hypothetical protein
MRTTAFALSIVAALSFSLSLSKTRAQESPGGEEIHPAPDVSWTEEIAAARARHDDWLSCERAKRFKCDVDRKPDPMAALLNDDTLVAGDVVATPQGLKVFRGQSQTPHRREDFQ